MADVVVKSIILVLIISSSLSESEARRLIESDDSGSGDRSWVVVHFHGKAEAEDSPADKIGFKVGDFIGVKFERDPVEVMLVTKDDYVACKSGHPIRVFNSMEAALKLDHPGMVYFISSVSKDCRRGHKEVIEVLP